ncbi:MAG: endonuclease MutS2, partial [Erysipelotrichaceae bacterium]|nr:endonuclease MutS2 [Erysipelotrichaceae bacterium]
MNSFYEEFSLIVEQMSTYCSFSLGKQALLATKPSFAKLVIKRDNQRIKEALELCYKYESMPFMGIKDITMALDNAAKGIVLAGQDFLNIIDNINGTKGIITYMKQAANDYPSISELTNTLVVCDKLLKMLNECFDAYGQVSSNASEQLRAIRQNLGHIDQKIAETANRFVRNHSASVVDGIISTRNNRVCILMKASDKNSYGGFVHGESASGMASYVEPQELIGLNNQKQALLDKEQIEILRILTNCTNLVAQNYHDLHNNLATITLLDVIFAKASWGKKHDACVASLDEHKHIYLKKAFHPLIDAQKVVKNDYRLGDQASMLLITGPNTGGKTVTLKVMALSVLMTYSGMPVCADTASIGFFDQVFIDIGDMQSVEQSLSTFSAHLSNLAYIIDHATSSSLVLLDEIGSGTDPKEGEALAIAIFNYLRQLQCYCVATTHYNRLKTYGKRHDDVLVASVLFDEKTLSPTYKYIENLTGQSNALTIAAKYGLKKQIINEARFLTQQNKTQEEVLIEKLEQQLNEAQQLNQQLQAKLEENKELQKELKAKKIKLDEQLARVQDDAMIKAQQYIDEIKQQADDILSNIRKQNNGKYHEVLAKTKQLDELIAEEIEEADDEKINVNDYVEIKQTNQVAKVLSIDRQNVLLDLNGIKVKSKLSKIRKSHKHIVKKTIKQPKKEITIKTMPLECNLIGLRV